MLNIANIIGIVPLFIFSLTFTGIIVGIIKTPLDYHLLLTASNLRYECYHYAYNEEYANQAQ